MHPIVLGKIRALFFSSSEVKWKSLSHLHQATLSLGILQARILNWVAMASSRGSSQTRDSTRVSLTSGRLVTVWASREVQCVLFHDKFQEVSRDQIYWYWVFLSKWSYSTFIKNNGILLNLKKEHWVSCSDVHEPRACHIEVRKRKTNIAYQCIYNMESRKWY